jgi:autotransporter-associated beta strand protein
MKTPRKDNPKANQIYSDGSGKATTRLCSTRSRTARTTFPFRKLVKSDTDFRETETSRVDGSSLDFECSGFVVFSWLRLSRSVSRLGVSTMAVLKRLISFFAVLAILSLAAPTAEAQLTWDPAGGGSSDGAGAWLTAGDWWNGGANVNWTSGSDAVFGNGGAGGAVTLASPTTVNSLTMNSFTGTYTLGTANQTITLNNGITMNAGAGATTIISPITLGGAQSWTNNDDSLLTVGTGAVTNGGFLLTVGGTGNTTISSAIGGAGGLTKSDAGTLTLSGSNGFAGQLTVGAGTLSIASINNASAAGTLGNSTLSVILGSSGNTGTLSYTGGNATSTKRFTFAAGGTGQINVSTGATTLTLSGLIDGSGGLTKIGAGNLTLSNNPNQFTGNTLISNGRVVLGGQYAMWQSAYDTTGSTGAIGLNVTGQAAPWLGGVAGSVNLATAITGYGSVTTLTLNPQSGSSVSYGGVIANGAANMQLSKTGHGTQTLTGANTYSGATTVWAGTLSLAGASGTAQNSPFTVRGGMLLLDNSTAWANRLNDATAISLGSLTLTSSNGAGAQTETVGATTFAVGGKVTINNGSTVGDQTTLSMGAVTRSAGAAIDFVGAGGTLGAGANSPNVTSTSLPANTNGILEWATVNGTQWAENNSNSIRAYSGSFFAINSSTNAQNAQVSGSDTLSGARVANSLNLIATGAGQSLSLGGNNLTLGSAAGSPGAILKSGTDAYTISGTGQVRAGSAGAGTELIAHVDGGALTISAPLATAIVNLAKGGTGDLILSGTRAGTMGGNISIAGGQLEFRGASTTLSGVITGAGGLTVNLNGGQTLTMGNNSNSYAGPTIVRGGYLASPSFGSQGMPGGLNQTPSTNTSQIMSNLILEGGVFNSSYTFNKDLGAGPGQVQVLAGTSGFVNTASAGGAVGFVLNGGRELVWGSAYFNPTTFVHSLNANNNSTSNLSNGFDLAGSTRTVLVGDATYNSTVGVSQLSGNIRTSSGTAGLTKTGIGTLLLSGTNTYNGPTTISSGILRFQNQVSLYNNTPSSWTAANIVVANGGTLALNVGGAGQFTTGNVTTLLTNLGGANGTSTTGFAAGSSIGFDTTNAAGSTFTVADSIVNSSGSGGGAIGVVKLGSNTLVLSGATNSYSGATLIRGGTLSLTGSLTGGTAITTADNNNGGGGTALQGILNQGAASVISGGSSITQSSTGTSTLSGNNSYTGGTTLNAGTLIVGHANALGTGTGTIALNSGTIQSNDATARTFTNAVTIGGNPTIGGTGNLTFSSTGASALGASRTITVTNSGVNATFAQAFSGTGFSITKSGAGTLTLSGNNSLVTGGTTINAGTLVTVGASALPVGTITMQTGSSTLHFQRDSSLTVGNAWSFPTRNFTQTIIINRESLGSSGNWTISQNIAQLSGNTMIFQKGSLVTNTPTVTLSSLNSSDSTAGIMRLQADGVNLSVGSVSNTRAQTNELSANTDGNVVTGHISQNNSFPASVSKVGNGTWTLSGPGGANFYTGTTTVNAGTLRFGRNTALYNNTPANWTAANLNVKSGATLAFNVGGTGEFTTGNITTLLANLAASSSATNGMNAGSTFGFDTTNASGGNFTIADAIADTTGASGGARGVTKLGTNTLILTNANTYTGPTSVVAGTLAVNGSLGNTAVTVGSGATLRGSGTIGGSISVVAGGTFGAGNSIESLGSNGTISLAGNSTFLHEIDSNAAPGVAADLVYTTAGLDIASGSILNITELGNGTWAGAPQLTLISYNGTWNGGLFTYNGTTLNNGDTFNFSGVDWVFSYNGTTAGTNYTAESASGTSFVTMFAVPEPTAIALAASGLIGLGLAARRRFRRA